MILTLLFFASLCVVVILALRALPQRINAGTAETRTEILVAATVLQIGTLLRAKDVTWQEIGGNAGLGQIARPRTAAGNLNLELDQQARAEVYGAALRSSVMAGEPISRGAIVKPGDRDFLQVVLLPQARAIAIPVTTGGASTGILYPGDRVDVILTQTFKNDPPLARRSVGETVVENLRVLYRLPGIPRCGRVIRQAYHVWGIGDASILFSQRTGGGGAAAPGTARERACLPAGSDDREPARGDGA